MNYNVFPWLFQVNYNDVPAPPQALPSAMPRYHGKNHHFPTSWKQVVVAAHKDTRYRNMTDMIHCLRIKRHDVEEVFDADIHDNDEAIPMRAIHYAAALDNVRMVETLVQYGQANLKACIQGDLWVGWEREEGWTPFHYAAEYENIKVLRWLLEEHNVNPLIEDAQGRLPLAMAVYNIQRHQGHRIKMVRWLLHAMLHRLGGERAVGRVWDLLERSAGRVTKRTLPVMEELRADLIFRMLRVSPHLVASLS